MVVQAVRALAISRLVLAAASVLYAAKLLAPLAFAGLIGRGVPVARTVDQASCRPIFDAIASHEAENRKNGSDAFPTEAWSAEDHRAAFERDVVRSVAAERAITLSYAYRCFDQGIRERWPGPSGKALPAQVVPLDPRRR